MARVDCDYCGLPFTVRRVVPGERVYCCAGCALADRVKTGDGPFPVTPELVLALLAGFAAFNQLLFLLLSGLLAGEDRTLVALRFWWASLAAGAIAWGLTTVAQFRSGARRLVDGTVAALGAIFLILGGLLMSGGCVIAGTFAVIVWGARGWARSRASIGDEGRPQK